MCPLFSIKFGRKKTDRRLNQAETSAILNFQCSISHSFLWSIGIHSNIRLLGNAKNGGPKSAWNSNILQQRGRRIHQPTTVVTGDLGLVRLMLEIKIKRPFWTSKKDGNFDLSGDLFDFLESHLRRTLLYTLSYRIHKLERTVISWRVGSMGEFFKRPGITKFLQKLNSQINTFLKWA